MNRAAARRAAHNGVAANEGALLGLSHRIHAHPELGFEEARASAWLCEALADQGFRVDKGICDLPTAFQATVGSGPLQVALCAEYDALPGIGHACGHNMIAAMSTGAAFALAPMADDLGLTVHVIGTPAEEGGGGKALLVERGAFDGVHAALMVHPTPLPHDSPAIPLIALANVRVHYTGRAAHASAFPELGVNALDALTVAQTAIGLLRQHLHAGNRVHGIVTKGGDAPNIVPADASGHWFLRATTLQELQELEPRVMRCFEAGALATGAVLRTEHAPRYADMHHDEDLVAVYRSALRALGRPVGEGDAGGMPPGSSDMGNVSHVVPSIHPAIAVDGAGAVNHQAAFAAACAAESADRAVLDGAVAMAWTAIDAAADGPVRERLLARAGTVAEEEPGAGS